MKRRKSESTVLIVLLILFCPSIAWCKELDVPFHRQNTIVWCWAATIAMIGEYVTGHSAEDCEVLSAYDRAFGGPGNCCEFPRRCTRTGSSQEMKFILGNIFGMSGYHHVRPLRFREIMNEIDNDRPFIVALRSSFSGHVVVVSGYKAPKKVIILDPISGRHVISYEELIGGFRWGS